MTVVDRPVEPLRPLYDRTPDSIRLLAGRASLDFQSREVTATTYPSRVQLAREVLEWAGHAFGDKLTVASSMGDTVLIHLAGVAIPGVDVFFIDTGYHFAETLGTRDAYGVMLPLLIRTIAPRQSVAEQDSEHGSRLFEREPDRCCALRKVEPLERALVDRQAWVSGLRRADAVTRTGVELVGWDVKRAIAKLNPIAAWTDEDVERYTAENAVFENPLKQIGYASIGCAPCTRPVRPGEDPRAGRWAGRAKVECGLHA
ncbi:MAG TPA: phosphoadenylyl-sulfate reductase [Candidatus Lustribacter sp.]|nr:phosphoadenylyl-sulfate reductase [Candidatus Lustribacter sp.]